MKKLVPTTTGIYFVRTSLESLVLQFQFYYYINGYPPTWVDRCRNMFWMKSGRRKPTRNLLSSPWMKISLSVRKLCGLRFFVCYFPLKNNVKEMWAESGLTRFFDFYKTNKTYWHSFKPRLCHKTEKKKRNTIRGNEECETGRDRWYGFFDGANENKNKNREDGSWPIQPIFCHQRHHQIYHQ